MLMEQDKLRLRQIYRLMFFAALLVLSVIYIKEIWQAIRILAGILQPFFIGGALAFLLNILMNIVEKSWLKSWKGKLADKIKRPVSLFAALFLILMLLALMLLIVVPQLAETIGEIGNKIPGFVEDLLAYLSGLVRDNPWLESYLLKIQEQNLNWDSIMENLTGFLRSGVTSMLSSTFSIAGGIISAVTNTLIGLTFAFYILGQKEKLAAQGKKLRSEER